MKTHKPMGSGCPAPKRLGVLVGPQSAWVPSIMHQFSTELHSISDSAIITYLNTDSLFVYGLPSFTQ